MREIKFRIYDPIKKKMLESGGTPTMLASFFRNTAVLNVRDDMEYQQFTGLLDKSGKEIYEGDIVASDFRSKNSEKIYTVEWVQRDAEFSIQSSDVCEWCVEIIGNIWENKELLNENK